MSRLSKVKLMGILAFLLFCLNIALLLFVFTRPPHKPLEGPQSIVEAKLQLDEIQKATYAKMIEDHQKAVSLQDMEILDIKCKLYQNLKEGYTPEVDSLISLIASEQEKIELLHYEHFMEIKSICTEEQLVLYTELVDDLCDLFMFNKTPRE